MGLETIFCQFEALIRSISKINQFWTIKSISSWSKRFPVSGNLMWLFQNAFIPFKTIVWNLKYLLSLIERIEIFILKLIILRI